MLTLFDLTEGEKAYIVKIKGRGQFRQRIMEMGFVVGKEVAVVKKAPLRDPIEYKILGYEVSLRKSESRLIEVIREGDGREDLAHNFSELINEADIEHRVISKRKNIQVALVGNPNSGKTTFFNYASGSKEKVGNYAGVTVNAKEAKYEQSGYSFNIIDLPGTYSIKSYSPEEKFVRNYIFENVPDVVINIVDASNLERNLYLTTQLIDMGIQVVIALNMYDELEKKGDRIDYHSLGKMIGVPVVPMVSSRGKGITELFDKVIDVYEGKDPTVRHIHINYGDTIEEAILSVQSKIKIEENREFTNVFSARFLAIALLENDPEYMQGISNCVNQSEIVDTAKKEIKKLEQQFEENIESEITDLKYGFIAGALKETLIVNPIEERRNSEIIDIFLTHKLFGIPVFIFFMWLTFYSTFTLGSIPKHGIELMISGISVMVNSIMPSGIFRDFLVNGIISGVGGVIVFLPNIILIFLFISLMEDTGYMARAVFIMDRAMHKIGLHGKSFIPLLMGFGCNVPAIMATRIIESRRDRLVTMLINPFMSCSARLPVYILFISAFFASYQGTILFSIYVIGVVIAVISALLFKKTILKSNDLPFVMELPPYRIPTFRSIFKHMWFRTELYLKKIGGIILLASIIIWILGNFPQNVKYSKDYPKEISTIINQYDAQIADVPAYKQNEKHQLLSLKENAIEQLQLEQKSELQSKSYIGMIGRVIEPVMSPLGFDWKMSVSIISGLAAKEVVISTMSILYQADNKNHSKQTLVNKLQTQTYTNGNKIGKHVFTPLVAASFILFILIYFPCIGVIAAIKRESGKWKWAIFSIVYTTCVAWIISFSVYQIGLLLN